MQGIIDTSGIAVVADNFNLALSIVIFSSILCIWTNWLRPRLEAKKPVDGVAMLPKSHWLFGHLFWLLSKPYLKKQRELADNADRNGRCGCWIGRQASLSLTFCEDAQQLLRNHHTRVSAPILKRHFEFLSGKRNLLLLNGEEWKVYSLALKSALSQMEMTHLQRIVMDTTRTFVEKMQAKIEANGEKTYNSTILELMKMITQDVFGLAAFSHDFGCCSKLQLSDFAKAFEFVEDDILDRCLRNPLLPQNLFYCIPTKRNRQLMRNRAYIRDFVSGIVRDRLAGVNSNKHDILGRLIATHTEKQKQSIAGDTKNEENTYKNVANEDDLVDIILSVLLAGYDTVSIALTYAIYLLCRHPKWEAHCSQEIQDTCVDDINNKHVEYPLCQAVMLESLRLYPVATALSRTLDKQFRLDDIRGGGASSMVTVPKGCLVGISVWSIHRSERHFPKPTEFRPDRWVTLCPKTKRWGKRGANNNNGDSIPAGNRNAFFAFSYGARSCPGQRFALEEATQALAVLLKGLKFEVDPNYQAEMEWKVIVQKPIRGIPATIAIR